MAGPPPLLGKTLANGKYRVKKLLGRGGMGAVYEGEHVEIGKRVAIKVIDPEHSKNDEVVERFRQEARAASRVESEHIVQVFDVGTDEVAGLYMVMEFLVGEDLSHRLDREGRVHVEVAVDIIYQAARGLYKAHQAGVVHRDLKPANVFLSARDDGLVTVKIVDFGISKMLVQPFSEKDNKRPITRFGSAVGTPQYMSPEQAQGQTIDNRTDVWALGCVLYEMLSGEQAYKLLETYEQTIFHIVLKKPRDLREIAPWVPHPVIEVVEQALEHDLDLRVKDCATFAAMLQEALNGKSSGKEAPSRILHAVELGTRGPTSRNRIIASRPDAIVVPPSSERADHMSDATVPAMDIPLDLPMSRPQPPPTVAGVTAVKRLAVTPTSDPPSSSRVGDLSDLVEPPPRKRGGFARALLVVLLIGAAASVGFFIVNRPGTTPAAAPPAATESSTTANTNTLAATKPTQLASAKPSIGTSSTTSVSGSTSASIKSSTSGKPTWGKPPIGMTAVPTTTEPTATATDQFGGTGVSSTF